MIPACESKFVSRSSYSDQECTYSLGRPRSPPSLVGDSGQVLGVLGWALTGIRNLPLVLECCRQEMSTVAVFGGEL